TGGADTFARLTHGGFNALRSVDPEPCRPFDRRRKGLSIGEAAGLLVFEEEERARRRGAPIHARFLGYGVTSDAHHMTQPEPTGDLDVVPNESRDLAVEVALSNSFAFGGNSTTVAFGRV